MGGRTLKGMALLLHSIDWVEGILAAVAPPDVRKCPQAVAPSSHVVGRLLAEKTTNEEDYSVISPPHLSPLHHRHILQHPRLHTIELLPRCRLLLVIAAAQLIPTP